MKEDTGRYPYLSLVDRPRIVWPDGARVALWVAPNIEFYELTPPSNPGRAVWWRPHPDVLSYSQRDYGNRVGVWRLMEVMRRFGVRGSVSLNAALCDHIPEIIDACAKLGWEFFSHGVYNTRVIYGMDDDQLRELISDSVETIRKHTGQEVAGWLAPALSSVESIFDLLPEFGIKYTLDVAHDDQPTPLRVRNGRLISIPYSGEVNDMGLLAFRGISADRYVSTLKAQFDQLYEEGADNGMVVSFPVHPFLIGQPHRINAFAEILEYVTSRDKVWLATGREIADWYYTHYYAAAANSLKSLDQAVT